jgi:hypothetical protein
VPSAAGRRARRSVLADRSESSPRARAHTASRIDLSWNRATDCTAIWRLSGAHVTNPGGNCPDLAGLAGGRPRPRRRGDPGGRLIVRAKYVSLEVMKHVDACLRPLSVFAGGGFSTGASTTTSPPPGEAGAGLVTRVRDGYDGITTRKTRGIVPSSGGLPVTDYTWVGEMPNNPNRKTAAGHVPSVHYNSTAGAPP